MKCILFIFAGRKLYLEIQKQYLRVLLYRFPFLEIHFWNFTRNEKDNEYIQILAAELPRTKIFNHLYDGENEETNCTKRIGKLCACRKCRVGRWAESYRFYAAQPHSEENIYVKLDDDILYLDTHRFYQFYKFAKDNPEKIISANVFNNGVCALHNPRLRDEIIEAGLVTSLNHESWWGLCTSLDFFFRSHISFLQDAELAKSGPLDLVDLPTTRFSINSLAFSHRQMKKIAEHLKDVAAYNDEHIISQTCQISILRGFVTSHLHYADQRAILTDKDEELILRGYRIIAEHELQAENRHRAKW